MGRVGDFSAPIKKALAERAGLLCSFPGCGAVTIGPSDESPTSTAKTGMACHIYAASDGPAARRVQPTPDIEKLTSIENGVWMCFRHGKLIDADECKYTPELLVDWRRLAEKLASLRHSLGRELTAGDVETEPLAVAKLELTTPEFINQINTTFEGSAVAIIWGRQNAMMLRDLVIEIARNALTHGKASHFHIKFNAHTVELSDDGNAFSLTALEKVSEPRGGAMALREISRRAPQIITSYRREGSRNILNIAFSRALKDLLLDNPCSTTVYGGMESVNAAIEFVTDHPQCGTIFLRPAFGILSYSDLHNLSAAMKHIDFRNLDIALVMEPHSDGIRDFLKKEMPRIRLIETSIVS